LKRYLLMLASEEEVISVPTFAGALRDMGIILNEEQEAILLQHISIRSAGIIDMKLFFSCLEPSRTSQKGSRARIISKNENSARRSRDSSSRSRETSFSSKDLQTKQYPAQEDTQYLRSRSEGKQQRDISKKGILYFQMIKD